MTASSPLAASPTTSKPGSPLNMPRSPSRTTGWSSTISTRMTRWLGLACSLMPGSPGRSRETAVPSPGADSISSRPATRPTRCRIPVSPKPLPSATASGRPARSNPIPSSRTSSVTTSSMYDKVTPTRLAAACLPTLASASCPVRSSAISTSGCSCRAVPVVVTAAGTPLTSDQRAATSASASGSRAASSGSGRSACTDRRASTSVERASSAAVSRCRSRPVALAVRAACSWATIPVRPCASVSWISRASRSRSSRTPASRAEATSCACSCAFSAIAAASRSLASLSSSMVRLRAALCSSVSQP